MTKLIKNFLTDNSGAAAAEYALILAVIGSGIAVAAMALGTEIQTAITRTTGELRTANGTTGG